MQNKILFSLLEEKLPNKKDTQAICDYVLRKLEKVALEAHDFSTHTSADLILPVHLHVVNQHLRIQNLTAALDGVSMTSVDPFCSSYGSPSLEWLTVTGELVDGLERLDPKIEKLNAKVVNYVDHDLSKEHKELFFVLSSELEKRNPKFLSRALLERLPFQLFPYLLQLVIRNTLHNSESAKREFLAEFLYNLLVFGKCDWEFYLQQLFPFLFSALLCKDLEKTPKEKALLTEVTVLLYRKFSHKYENLDCLIKKILTKYKDCPTLNRLAERFGEETGFVL